MIAPTVPDYGGACVRGIIPALLGPGRDLPDWMPAWVADAHAVVLFVLDPTLALITLGLVMPITLILSNWFRRRSDRSYGAVRERIAEVLSDLSESLAGIRVITAHNRRRHNVVNHTNVVGDHKDANLAAIKAASIYTPGTEAISIFGQAMILLIGGNMVLNGNLEIGELTAFLLLKR